MNISPEAVASLASESAKETTIPLSMLSEGIEGEWIDPPPEIVSAVCIDSRECQANTLFVALEGEETDGHRFLDDARTRGAEAAIVREPVDDDLPQFVVDDPREALQQLSVAYREHRSDLFVIGITGTCGKTTVKEMLYQFLSGKYEAGRTPGNRNNELGVPLTILNEGSGDVLVAELATSEPGEISRLTEWSQPRIGVISHIGPAHLEGLGSIEVVAREKAQLLSGLPDDGIAFVPDELPRKKQVTLISSVEPRSVVSQVVSTETVSGETILVEIGSEEYQLPFSAPHLIENSALAISVAREMGVSQKEIQQRLQNFDLLPGRGEIHTWDGTRVIDGSYNANPDSFRASLKRLQSFPGPRLALVGDMLELGDEAECYHRDLGEDLGQLKDADIYYVGEFSDEVRAGLGSGIDAHWYETVDELPDIDPTEYQTVLVKSSHGIGLHRVLKEWLDQR